MSIKCKMISRKDYLNTESNKKEGVYPQIVRNKTVKIDELANTVAKGKRFQSFEVKIILACICASLLLLFCSKYKQSPLPISARIEIIIIV